MFYKITRFILLYVVIGAVGTVRHWWGDHNLSDIFQTVLAGPPTLLVYAPGAYVSHMISTGILGVFLSLLFIFLVVMVFYFGYKFIRSGVWRYLAFASILSIPPQYHIVISKIVLGWFHA